MQAKIRVAKLPDIPKYSSGHVKKSEPQQRIVRSSGLTESISAEVDRLCGELPKEEKEEKSHEV